MKSPQILSSFIASLLVSSVQMQAWADEPRPQRPPGDIRINTANPTGRTNRPGRAPQPGEINGANGAAGTGAAVIAGRAGVVTAESTGVVSTSGGTASVTTVDANGRTETHTFSTAVPLPPKPVPQRGPWLGMAMEPLQEVVTAQLPLTPGEGLAITFIDPEGPAAKAGLQRNDILLRWEDQIAIEPMQIKKLVGMRKPGDSVKLTILRKGERKQVEATLVEHEIEPPDFFIQSVQPLNPGRPGQPGPTFFTMPLPPPTNTVNMGDERRPRQPQLPGHGSDTIRRQEQITPPGEPRSEQP